MKKLFLIGTVFLLAACTPKTVVLEASHPEVLTPSSEVQSSELAQFSHRAELVDVTDGEPILGVDFSEIPTGMAEARFDENGYVMGAVFENLPDPGENFYEGWLVQSNPPKAISSGVLEKTDGGYVNNLTSSEDLLNYDSYVLTLEPNDNDPAPAYHVLEGEFELL